MSKMSRCNFARLKAGTMLFDSVRNREVEFECWKSKKDSQKPFEGPTIQVNVDGQSLVHDASDWRFSRLGEGIDPRSLLRQVDPNLENYADR
jgi:hypothetical protein